MSMFIIHVDKAMWSGLDNHSAFAYLANLAHHAMSATWQKWQLIPCKWQNFEAVWQILGGAYVVRGKLGMAPSSLKGLLTTFNSDKGNGDCNIMFPTISGLWVESRLCKTLGLKEAKFSPCGRR